MGQVIVRNLEDEVIERHRARARRHGVSLEQELRDVLTTSAKLSREEKLRRMREIRAMTPEPPPGVEPVEGWVLIREDRDSR